MSDALAKARAIADAAMPVWKYRGSIPSALHGRTFDPPTVLAMLDAIEAADVACKQGRPVDAFQALNDVDDALARFCTLIGDNRE